MNEQLTELKRPFPIEQVKWRIAKVNEDSQTGLIFAYIDARNVMKRLDEIFPMQWQARYSHAGGGSYICEIGIKIDGEWLWRANGAGETVYEAEKGGMSDAFKRAAVLWGIGQYLYKLPSSWANLTKTGRDWKINQPPELPKWATPEGYDDIIGGKKEYTEKQLATFIDDVEHDRAINVYEWHLEDYFADMLKEFPEGKKTELKRKAADLVALGRHEFYQIAEKLEQAALDNDTDSLGEIIDEFSPRFLARLINEVSGDVFQVVSQHIKSKEEAA